MTRRTTIAVVGIVLVVVVAAGPACTKVRTTLVNRATGTWHCTSSAADTPFDVQVDPNGAFRLQDSARVGVRSGSTVDGSWTLEGTKVAVDLHPSSPTGQVIRATGVREAATRIRLRSWLGGHGTSEVSYHDGTVTIRDDVGGSTTWTCQRTSSHDPGLPRPPRTPPIATSTTAPRPTTTEPAQVIEPFDGVWFRFVGPDRPDDPTTGAPRPNVDITVLEDGRVISVGDTSIYASTEDYTTFTLSRRTLDHLLSTIDSSGVLDHDDQDDRADADGSALFYGDGSVVEPVPAAMSTTLSDLSSLGAGVSATTPWQPDKVSVTIARYDPTRRVQDFDKTVQRWPLAGTVSDLVATSQRPPETDDDEYDGGGDVSVPHANADGEILVGTRCVSGDDARKLFALMKPGVTNVRLRVDDGSALPWQVAVEPVIPGQGTDGPCG